ncbi:hypothetical protein K3495_g13381, partial [Podosphaera aphanis]
MSYDPSRNHLCPPKCVNCHGPHPADFLECLVRPRKDNTLPTRSQLSEIRKAAAAARLRLKAAHCGIMNVQAETAAPANNEAIQSRPQTPPTIRGLFAEKSSTTGGKYAVLAQESYDRKVFRKVVSQAKTQFFQKITDQAANPKDVFNIAKWHKSKGDFRTPPLIDPYSPDSPPAQNVEEKRNLQGERENNVFKYICKLTTKVGTGTGLLNFIYNASPDKGISMIPALTSALPYYNSGTIPSQNLLARNLLCNQSEAEDIPLSAPSVPRAALPFPELTLSEISRAILGAGNTTPGKDQIPTAVLRLAW